MLREHFRAARLALSSRITTRLFQGTYTVAMHGERGWEPEGDPVLYYLYPKRQVWAEAQPIDSLNYRIVQREVKSGHFGLGNGFFGGSETRSITQAGRQIFSRQEACEILARRETALEREGFDGKLLVKRNTLFDMRHYRRFAAQQTAALQQA